LQRSDVDIYNAFDRVAGLKASPHECRTDDRFEQLWQEATDACTSLDIDIPQQLQKRHRKVSKSLYV